MMSAMWKTWTESRNSVIKIELLNYVKCQGILSLRSSVYSWFWDRALILPSGPGFMFSCLSVLEPCALLSAYLVSCWSVVFGSWHSCLEFRFVSGLGHSRSVSVIVCARSRVHSLRALLSTCVLLLHAVRVSIGCVHSCLYLCCVARSLCISLAACFHVVMSVWTRGLWVFSLAACSCLVFAHGWWFVCWPCACVFVLCEHVASVL